MTTSLDLITRAMRLSRVIGKGETPDASEAQDGLESLNSMLDSWQIERLFVYAIRTEQFTWTANTQAMTIGAAGNWVTDLPTRVDDASSFTINSIDYPVRLIDKDAWSAIPAKTTTSTFPFWIYPEYSPTLVTLYGYPLPSASITFNLRTWKQLQQFTDLTTVLSLPPGYKRAIVYSLAEEFGGEFGVEVPPKVERIAAKARSNIKRINQTPNIMASEVGYMNRRYVGNVYADIPG